MFSSGADTTPGVVALMFYHLLLHRDVYDRLTQELDEAFPSGELQPEDIGTLAKLPYMTAVVNEGLRLASPLSGMPRVVPKGGLAVKGRYIPEGSVVSVPIWAQHVSPENFFPAPLDFLPQRWLPGGLGPDSVLRPTALMSFQFGTSTMHHISCRISLSDNILLHRRLRLHWQAFGHAPDQCRYRSPAPCL